MTALAAYPHRAGLFSCHPSHSPGRSVHSYVVTVNDASMCGLLLSVIFSQDSILTSGVADQGDGTDSELAGD
ncbi:hypothetical protein DACRYDRAFT_19804 [Dacryopinax primogenitus]|uniref:Uncharacterized protein n=1 Tax=Dacryopinax primogenitus (strain DJM 731) TaxID=1858805 RepID=M5G4P8_DACPD|nr:uncharacterized protein DACRYDRAFT_19804 [Dacryopinax primogenitus]EJU05226.1 hypothetical protein DACRYDRAFT_19804 [Dacryopinax primogenitus]